VSLSLPLFDRYLYVGGHFLNLGAFYELPTNDQKKPVASPKLAGGFWEKTSCNLKTLAKNWWKNL